jgi:hypothetical protein
MKWGYWIEGKEVGGKRDAVNYSQTYLVWMEIRLEKERESIK